MPAAAAGKSAGSNGGAESSEQAGAAGSKGTAGAAGLKGTAGAPGAAGAASNARGVELSCQSAPLVADPARGNDATVLETRTGSNGTFTDHCEDGDLVAYYCDYYSQSSSSGESFLFNTGEVASMGVSCDGHCIDGTCPNLCPSSGDTMRYLTRDANGHATFDDLTSGAVYDCDFATMFDTQGFDCRSDPQPGDEFPVTANIGVCTTHAYFTLVPGDNQACAYAPCMVTLPGDH